MKIKDIEVGAVYRTRGSKYDREGHLIYIQGDVIEVKSRSVYGSATSKQFPAATVHLVTQDDDDNLIDEPIEFHFGTGHPLNYNADGPRTITPQQLDRKVADNLDDLLPIMVAKHKAHRAREQEKDGTRSKRDATIARGRALGFTMAPQTIDTITINHEDLAQLLDYADEALARRKEA